MTSRTSRSRVQIASPMIGAADEAQCQADAVNGGVGPSLGRGIQEIRSSTVGKRGGHDGPV